MHRLTQQLLVDFVFRRGRAALFLARFWVGIDLSFRHQMIAHWHRHILYMVQRADDIDPFDGLSAGVIVMPTDDGVLVGMRLFRNAIIHNQNAIRALNLADVWLDDLPKFRTCFHRTRQKALNPVMTDRAIQQSRQSRACGQSKRTDQVVRVNVQQFFIVHAQSLQYFRARSA